MDTTTGNNRGWKQFVIGVVAYVLIVLFGAFLLDPDALSPAVGVLLALLPMAAAIWAMLGWLDAIRNFDELQRKILSEAGLLSLGVTAAATFTYGFLETLAGAPHLSMFVVLPFIALSCIISLLLSLRRYR